MGRLFVLLLWMSCTWAYAQDTPKPSKFALSVVGGYQFTSDLSIVSYLEDYDILKPETSDFFGGATFTYIQPNFDLSVGFQSAYQDSKTDLKRSILYTRVLEFRGLYKLPFHKNLKIGGSIQKKLQEFKAYSENSNMPIDFLGIYAYSSYYFSPTIAYEVPLLDKINLQISAQQTLSLSEDRWTNFKGDDLDETSESQSTFRIFMEVFYKL